LSVTSQTLSPFVVMPPSGAAGPRPNTALTTLRVASTLARAGTCVHNGTQTLPNPTARPPHGSPGNSTVAINVLVRGSMRWTALGPVLPTQTASEPTATQSAVVPSRMTTVGFNSPIGRESRVGEAAVFAAAGTELAGVELAGVEPAGVEAPD